MKIFLVGKSGSITHWLEDAATAFRAGGHAVRVGTVRRSWLNAGLEAALIEPLAARMSAAVRRFAPDLILAIGGFHVPPRFLQALSALPGRPPLVGWVGDLFDNAASARAQCYDLVAYTDSGLLARHRVDGFPSASLFLPHAASGQPSQHPGPRAPRMVFVGNATVGRCAVIEGVDRPVAVFGPGWPDSIGRAHELHAGRLPHRAVSSVYAEHLAALNIRNEHNVLTGLNQRSFDPCLSATPVVTDDQGDLETCFDPGSEVLVWRSIEELNAEYARLIREPEAAARVGESGRRRVLAQHTYAHRLASLAKAL